MSEVIAIVPARGGSKSLPRKNVRPFAGHPLLAWSIEAARAAGSVDRVIVSTDDAEIRHAALAYGAEVPFLRPAQLAADDTPDLPVFEHALTWLEAHGVFPDLLVQLRPTSPLRQRGWIDQAVALLRSDPRADSVRTVTAPAQNPHKMWRLSGERLVPLLGSLDEELYNHPRQALPDVLWQTGHVDVFRTRTVRERSSLTGRCILPLLVPPATAVDIDTFEEWAFAEWLVRRGDFDVAEPQRASPPAGRKSAT